MENYKLHIVVYSKTRNLKKPPEKKYLPTARLIEGDIDII